MASKIIWKTERDENGNPLGIPNFKEIQVTVSLYIFNIYLKLQKILFIVVFNRMTPFWAREFVYQNVVCPK